MRPGNIFALPVKCNVMNAVKFTLPTWAQRYRIRQFVQFCVVGASGFIVDMAVLHFLAEPKWCGWNVTLSKICSAGAAMLNNFIWNELWTFRHSRGNIEKHTGVMRRLVWFYAICCIGIGLAVLFLNLFYSWLGFNLYVANFLAIVLVTVWNFWMNAIFNWRVRKDENQTKPDSLSEAVINSAPPITPRNEDIFKA
jgi:putative flippase GtrA